MKSTMARWKKMEQHQHHGLCTPIDVDVGEVEKDGATPDREATGYGKVRCGGVQI